jgi:glutamate dehydrogenase
MHETDGDARHALLIEAIQTELDKHTSGMPIPSGCADIFFGRLALEDIEGYNPEMLAQLILNSLNYLMETHTIGQHNLHIRDHVVDWEGKPRTISVLDVINDNMPFLLDSTLAALMDFGHEILLVTHPILAVERSPQGTFESLSGEALLSAPPGTHRESLIHIHMPHIGDEAARARLIEELNKVYTDIRLSVNDWAPMRGRIAEAMESYAINPPPLPHDELSEALRFLEWINTGNFAMLGLCTYDFQNPDTADSLVPGSGLGILRDPSVKILRRGREFVSMTPEIRIFLEKPIGLFITKANVKSRVHRRVHLDYIGIKLFTPDGRLEGELRLVGLFTANAYVGSVTAIPYLRHKASQVILRAGFDATSYSGRSLLHVLDEYPRDELFQIDVDRLYTFSMAILQLTERPRVRAFARVDEFDRFVCIIVYIPKDRYDAHIRETVARYLATVYNGRISAVYPSYPEGPLARTHYIIGRDEGQTPKISQNDLEAGIRALVATWSDSLNTALQDVFPDQAALLSHRYGHAFPAGYRDAYPVASALPDIQILETLSPENPYAATLYQSTPEDGNKGNLKVFAYDKPLPLSERVPVLEALGFHVISERTFHIKPQDPSGKHFWLHDLALERQNDKPLDLSRSKPLIEGALSAILSGDTESDAFNALVLEANLEWHDVAVLRALSRYLKQLSIPYDQNSIAQSLVRYPQLAITLIELFYARFDPHLDLEDRERRIKNAHEKFKDLLKNVVSLDDDRILNFFMTLIEATVRTNFFQRELDGQRRPTIAFKFDNSLIDNHAALIPFREIFMYGPRVEGLHIRFGKVARGGLRWSDRQHDLRTEILGLVKAQNVKNAVIVPRGAKGGFVPRCLPPSSDRNAWLAEGTAAYKIFIATLLDMTDNIEGGHIVRPALTICRDESDPYLVVAADKGTATFSDIANEISLAHNFWLGDAFASGSSNGYDHKAMGITARGAWEAVKRHFREMDIDIQSTPITVAGVGDMSGDVFGNGMLLSKELKLVAAFDHRHIFIDPHPDPHTAYAERERLFHLPRSTWADYDTTKISKGGGVFARSLKAIPLSEEAKILLGLQTQEASPFEVMRAILALPVDFLWFGGIGTYIRASDETDDQVGDRANDAIRITGADLRCKVIGEGANLGCTQRGRIEAARRGIRLNTDAIDNSAGVNTSDIEVNIKIALTRPSLDGRLSPQERNAFLESMKPNVAHLALANNYRQPLTLSLATARGVRELNVEQRLINILVDSGRLNRKSENLPSDTDLAVRSANKEGLTRPEIAVLQAYAKLALHDELLASSLVDNPFFLPTLRDAFPPELHTRFPDAIEHHHLRREIIATQLANRFVNDCGPATCVTAVDQTGTSSPMIVAGYAVVQEVYGFPALRSQIDALDGKIPSILQLRLYEQLEQATAYATIWMAKHIARTGHVYASLDALKEAYKVGVSCLENVLEDLIPIEQHAEQTAWTEAFLETQAPKALVNRLARMPFWMGALDIINIEQEAPHMNLSAIAHLYFKTSQALRLGELIMRGHQVDVHDYYDGLVRDRAIHSLVTIHRSLTKSIALSFMNGHHDFDSWASNHQDSITQLRMKIDHLLSTGLSFSKLLVIVNMFDDFSAHLNVTTSSTPELRAPSA